MITSIPLRTVSSSHLGAVAGRVGLVVLLLVAVPSRVLNLDAFAGKFDEGIRGAQLMLMAAGYRPFRDIFASQGPLSLDVFFPTYLLFGQTLGAARLAPALFSVAGVLLGAWVAVSCAGRLAGAVTGTLLLISPIFLKNSRLALVEVPALVPAMAAVGATLAYTRSGDRRWLVGAGLLMALALAIKPMAAPALIPIGLALLLGGPTPQPPPHCDGEGEQRHVPPSLPRRGRVGGGAFSGWRRLLVDGAIFSAVMLAALAIIVVAVGPTQVYDQMIRFRAASRQVEGWSLKENWAAITGEIADEQAVFPVLVVSAGVFLLVARPRLGLPLVGWALGSLGLLLVYSPLQFKHAVILLPPCALLIGVAAGEVWHRWTTRAAGTRGPVILAGVALLIGVAYAVTVPRVLGLDWRLIAGMPESRPESFDDEIRLLSQLTSPSEFVIVDEPAVAFASRRLVPPSLVDTSMVRIRSRSLDANAIVAAAQQYDVRTLFLFSDGLRSLRRFADWVDDEYVAVKINERPNRKDRTIYLRQDADLAGARQTLERSLDQRSDATFGGQLRLLGYAVERGEARPGGSATVTLGWQALGPIDADYAVVTMLLGPDGQPIEQNQRGLGGGGEGTAAWEPGRWVFRTSTLNVRPGTPAGDYTLAVGLYDSKNRRLLPLDGAADGTTQLSLTTIQVRP